MAHIEGSWAVRYEDGTIQAQYDPASVGYDPEGGEVPFRAIEWDRVTHVIFESQWDRSELKITPAGPGYQWSLRARVTTVGDHGAIRMLILLHSVAGVPVDEHSVDLAYYWTPNGIFHECRKFDCGRMREYTAKLLHGLPPVGVPSIHDECTVQADSVLT